MYEVYDQDLKLITKHLDKESALREAEQIVRGPLVELGEATADGVEMGIFLIQKPKEEEI